MSLKATAVNTFNQIGDPITAYQRKSEDTSIYLWQISPSMKWLGEFLKNNNKKTAASKRLFIGNHWFYLKVTRNLNMQSIPVMSSESLDKIVS